MSLMSTVLMAIFRILVRLRSETLKYESEFSFKMIYIFFFF